MKQGTDSVLEYTYDLSHDIAGYTLVHFYMILKIGFFSFMFVQKALKVEMKLKESTKNLPQKSKSA